jgi:hypothetical protein
VCSAPVYDIFFSFSFSFSFIHYLPCILFYHNVTGLRSSAGGVQAAASVFGGNTARTSATADAAAAVGGNVYGGEDDLFEETIPFDRSSNTPSHERRRSMGMRRTSLEWFVQLAKEGDVDGSDDECVTLTLTSTLTQSSQNEGIGRFH